MDSLVTKKLESPNSLTFYTPEEEVRRAQGDKMSQPNYEKQKEKEKIKKFSLALNGVNIDSSM